MTTNKTTRYDNFMHDLRAKICAEYEVSPELRAEFATAADYVAFKMNEPSLRNMARRYKADCATADSLVAARVAENAGRVRILGQ